MPNVLIIGNDLYRAEDLLRRLSEYEDMGRVRAVGSAEAEDSIKARNPDVLIVCADSFSGAAIEAISGLWAGRGIRVILIAEVMTDAAVSSAARFGVSYCMARPASAAQIHDRVLMVSRAGPGTVEPARPAADQAARVNRLLNEFGISANCLGFLYLRASLMISLSQAERGKLMLTKDVYPRVAARYNTSGACVERAIRARINRAWENRDLPRSRMNCFVRKPCNSLFIAILTQILSRDGEREENEATRI